MASRGRSAVGSKASSSSSSSGESLDAPDPLSSSLSDTCSCSVNATSATPRSCYACVNVAPLSGGQCGIAVNGDCVSALEAKKQYPSQGNSSSLLSYFDNSTSASSYCEQSDSVCTQCRAVWRQELRDGVPANSSSASPRACVGNGGCVCLAVCEAYHVPNVTCSAPSVITAAPSLTTSPAVSPTQMDNSSDSSQPFGDYAWLFVFLALFVLMSVWSYQQTHVDENGMIRTSYRQLFRGRKKREVPAGPQLPLSGWRQYHERLIEEERAAIENGKLAKKKKLTRDGPDLTMQTGEGYRPASPGHVSHQQQAHLVSIFGM
ncbi:hypothetical protein Gpo141_00009185 [Globisporangium polare]